MVVIYNCQGGTTNQEKGEKKMKYRITIYSGENIWEPGWEKIFSIQPVQAWANSDFEDDEVDEFIDEIWNDLLDVDFDVPAEFLDEIAEIIREMLEGNNTIEYLAIEREKAGQ